MPSHLKRYQTEGSYHFITFSRYRRLPHLDNDPPALKGHGFSRANKARSKSLPLCRRPEQSRRRSD